MKNSKGFTLIELMVALTIFAILASFSVPGFSQMITRNQLDSTVRSFTDSIKLARNEAVSQGQTVRLSAADGDWKEGWDCHLILTGDPDGPTDTCKSAGTPHKSILFEADTAVMTFGPKGYSDKSTQFKILHTKLEDTTAYVCVSLLGRISVSDTTCKG